MTRNTRRIFVTLPVRSVPRSVAFFASLGFTFEPSLSDAHAACMVLNECSFAVLVAEDWYVSVWSLGTDTNSKRVAVGFECGTRTEVDDCLARCCASGGTAMKSPLDLGHVYSATFRDLDGHSWEAVWSADGFGGAPKNGRGCVRWVQ